MDDQNIHDHINELVATERRLRDRLSRGEITREQEHAELSRVEVELDRLWDLLRQRDARREFGENPDGARERPGNVVEDYEG